MPYNWNNHRGSTIYTLLLFKLSLAASLSYFPQSYMCMFMQVCIHTWHTRLQVPTEARRGCWILYLPNEGSGKSNSSPLQEQWALISTEPALQSSSMFLSLFFIAYGVKNNSNSLFFIVEGLWGWFRGTFILAISIHFPICSLVFADGRLQFLRKIEFVFLCPLIKLLFNRNALVST